MRVAVAVLGLALVTVPAHGAPHGDTKAMTIRVVSVTVGSETIVDKSPEGVLGAGDTLRAKSNLRNERQQFDRPKGALVGSEVAVYTFQTRAIGTVKVTTKLPGGTIQSFDRRTYEGCCATVSEVTGGTGVFAGARGTVRSEQLTRCCPIRPFELLGGRNLNIYRLRLP